ncbi:MAG TPA: hypothetical protein VKR31_11735 [Rhizomicrobium sp.]|nr:hypothetical protein [Rhizomicrobium sp.]
MPAAEGLSCWSKSLRHNTFRPPPLTAAINAKTPHNTPEAAFVDPDNTADSQSKFFTDLRRY